MAGNRAITGEAQRILGSLQGRQERTLSETVVLSQATGELAVQLVEELKAGVGAVQPPRALRLEGEGKSIFKANFDARTGVGTWAARLVFDRADAPLPTAPAPAQLAPVAGPTPDNFGPRAA